jgi:hypothetical protein
MNPELTSPPKWAQRVLGLTLMPRDQQTVAGDLLEEYRERISHGHAVGNTNLWYAKQVASLLWVAVLPGPMLLAAAVLTPYISAVLPALDFGTRGAVLLTTTAATYFLVGACGGWLTHRVRFATVMVATVTIVALLVHPAAALLHATLWGASPTPSQLRISGGHLALLMFPAFPLGLLIGMGGAAFARLLTGMKEWSRRRAVKRITY